MLGSQALGDDARASTRIPLSQWSLRRVPGLGRALLGAGPSEETAALATPPGWGWLPALSLTCALALVLIALGLSAATYPGPSKDVLFCAGASLLFLPLCARIAWPPASRFERIGLLLVAVGALYIIKLLASPLGFTPFDEFLHWKTADDIMVRQQLFTPNPLLPISPLYPGLEIAATAIANITDLPLFASALLLMAVSRVIFVCALFLLFEAITMSPRVGAVACIVYMGNSSYPIFHAAFSYESLAIVFLVLALLATACAEAQPADRGRRAMLLAAPFLLVLAVTHHLTACLTAVLLALLAAIALLGRDASWRRGALATLSASALLAASAWPTLMGSSITDYLLPTLQAALEDILQLLKTWTPVRKPFVSTDGSLAPLWQRATMLCALALVCLGLVMGMFRVLRHAGVKFVRAQGRMPFALQWSNNWLVMFALLTLVFPVTLAFRLTESAWELGTRLGPYVYFGVAPVVAFAAVEAWQGRSADAWRVTAVGAALAVMVVGALFTGWGGPIELPRRYKVIADALSVEAMGIDAARWTRRWLGPDRRFVSDRINRLLLTTYGRQDVVTSLQDQLDTSRLLFSPTLGPEELNTLKLADVNFLLVDMRLTQALPRLGVYFERGEDLARELLPPEPRALTKFNDVARVSRPFDNGYIIVYDVTGFVRRLRNER